MPPRGDGTNGKLIPAVGSVKGRPCDEFAKTGELVIEGLGRSPQGEGRGAAAAPTPRLGAYASMTLLLNPQRCFLEIRGIPFAMPTKASNSSAVIRIIWSQSFAPHSQTKRVSSEPESEIRRRRSWFVALRACWASFIRSLPDLVAARGLSHDFFAEPAYGLAGAFPITAIVSTAASCAASIFATRSGAIICAPSNSSSACSQTATSRVNDRNACS